MTTSSRNIKEFSDFETVYLFKIDDDALKELGVDIQTIDSLNSAVAVADYKAGLTTIAESEESIPEEAENAKAQIAVLDAAKITLCAVEDSVAEVNGASQLRQNRIPVKVTNEDTMGKAGAKYAAGSCDILTGTQAELASERAILEAADTHEIIPVKVNPVITNTPALAGFNIQGGAKLTPEFAALLIGLVLYTSAFSAEIVRAGILSVSKGQSEASQALGLSEFQRLRLIIIPQAMRVIIPPMTSQFLNLTKNSSLAVAIAYPDLVSVGNTVLNQSGFAIQVIIIFMATYLTISLSISAFLNWYNKKVALVER